MKKLLTITLILFSFASFAQADLDPVTVTASLTQSKISATGRDIVVIRGETFQNLPVHSLDELLRYVPGIEVQRGDRRDRSPIS